MASRPTIRNSSEIDPSTSACRARAPYLRAPRADARGSRAELVHDDRSATHARRIGAPDAWSAGENAPASTAARRRSRRSTRARRRTACGKRPSERSEREAAALGHECAAAALDRHCLRPPDEQAAELGVRDGSTGDLREARRLCLGIRARDARARRVQANVRAEPYDLRGDPRWKRRAHVEADVVPVQPEHGVTALRKGVVDVRADRRIHGVVPVLEDGRRGRCPRSPRRRRR